MYNLHRHQDGGGDGLASKSCLTLVAQWTVAHQVPLSMGFSSKITEVSCLSFVQGISPTQGLNLHLLC